MKIISVIPLARGIFKENLTYFTMQEVSLGMIITVPIRKKNIDALVVEVRDLAKDKSLVKTSAFSLKKIDKIKGTSALPGNFLKAAFRIKDYYGASPSSILPAVLPKIFLDNYAELNPLEASEMEKSKIKQEKLILQATLEERMSYYKTFIREVFAKKKSVFLCLPTIHDAEYFEKYLRKGIEDYVFVFNNELTKKEFIKRFNKFNSLQHPALVIGTPAYLFMASQKFDAVIVEHESSGAYKMLTRPYIDMRTWAEILTAQYNIKIIFGDTLLRMETLWRSQNYELSDVVPASFRLAKGPAKELVNMKKAPSTPLRTSGGFEVLSPELLGKIRESMAQGQRSFVFTHRKGLAGITICNDCQTPVSCESCQRPVALYESREKKRFFMCHHCRHKKDALVTCTTCQSWNLKALGIGTDLVASELAKEFPKAKIFRIDKEQVKTPKAGRETIEEFYKTKGAILVGTEMALHYLTDKVENTAVVSFDSLFAIPDFKMNEKIMRLLIELERYTKKSLTIQTRNPQERVLGEYFSGNLGEFAREELNSRKEFNYPPFFTPIKIIYRGPQENLEEASAYLEKLFADYNPMIFRAFVPKIKNLYVLNVVLKIKRENWSLPEIAVNGSLDSKLLSKLQTLPPALSVQVDPEDLL